MKIFKDQALQKLTGFKDLHKKLFKDLKEIKTIFLSHMIKDRKYHPDTESLMKFMPT